MLIDDELVADCTDGKTFSFFLCHKNISEQSALETRVCGNEAVQHVGRCQRDVNILSPDDLCLLRFRVPTESFHTFSGFACKCAACLLVCPRFVVRLQLPREDRAAAATIFFFF